MAGFQLFDLPLNTNHLHFEQVCSTNTTAWQQYDLGLDCPLWVTADVQTKGRGRRASRWDGGEGNLFATLLLSGDTVSEHWQQLPFVAGVGLFDSVSIWTPPGLGLWLKWPNDLMIDSAKLAGILVEAKNLVDQMAVVIGFGVNCRTSPALKGRLTTCLSQHSAAIANYKLFETLALNLDKYLNIWDNGKGFEAIRQAWLARTRGIGKPIKFNLDNKQICGLFLGIDQGGEMMIFHEGRQKRFASGEVFPNN